MTAPWPILLNIALRTTIVYFAVLTGLRLTGNRQLGQMSTFDLVLLLIISNAVQNAMVGPETSLLGGLVAASVLIGWHYVIDRWRFKNPKLDKLLEGEPLILIRNGKIVDWHCHRAGITRDDLLKGLREHGVLDVEDVKLAVLETDGSISVIRTDDLVGGSRPHHRIRAIQRRA